MRASLVAAAIVLLCAPMALGVPPGLYGLRSWAPGVYQIDPATGAAKLVTGMSAFTSLVGASFLGGEFWGCDVLASGFATGTIDLTSGAFTQKSGQDGSANWHGLASSDELGVLWTVDQDFGQALKEIRPDGTTKIIGYPGIDGRGMAWDETHNILYATSFGSGLYKVDITTGAATLIGDMGIPLDLVGLAYDESTQTLYANEGGSTHSLYRVDVTTGKATLVGPNGYTNIDGLAWIPEPTSLSLLAIGLLALRRR